MQAVRCLSVHKVSIALSALFLLQTVANARADEKAPQSFDIAPQPLSTALTAFARQSHEEILFAPDVVANRKTAGVKGTMTAVVALKVLLRESGLPFNSTPSGAILVGTVSPQSTIAGPAAPTINDSSAQEAGKN